MTDLTLKILIAQPKNPPQIFLDATAETVKIVRKAVFDRKMLSVKSLVAVDGHRLSWPQDGFQSYIDRNTGRPITRPIPGYASISADSQINFFEPYQRKFQKVCGVVSGQALTWPRHKAPLTLGGNVQGGPGGTCLIGSNIKGEPANSDHIKVLCGGGHPVTVPVHWLSVGHVDEAISVFRTGNGDCDYVIGFVSHEAMRQAFLARPDRPAFSISANSVQMPNFLCHYYLELKNIRKFPPPPDETRRLKLLFGAFVGEVHAQMSVGADPNGQCANMKNSDVVDVFDSTPELVKFNSHVREQIEKFKVDMTLAWTQLHPECKPRFIELPATFQGSPSPDSTYGGRSFFPNPANSIQVGKTVIFPNPGNEALRTYLSSQMASIDLSVEFVDTSGSNRWFGNLHCSSNSLNYCRTR